MSHPLIEEVAIRSCLSIDALKAIAYNAPRRYEVYRIPKKAGGSRLIAHPARELKIIQRATISILLGNFPVHEAAAAYRDKRGIRENAIVHVGSDPILKLDFESFFNSITAGAWKRFLRKQAEVELTKEEESFFTRILFWGRGVNSPRVLSVGAPSSPILSNAIMFDFDTYVSGYAEEHRVRYTRYADDIVASARSTVALVDFEQLVRSYIASNKTPSLTINESKRAIYTRGQRRMVTGLVITPQSRISIGRNRKREISALVHRFNLGQLDNEKQAYLKGMLAFALDNEPDFVARLNTKYGRDVISNILSLRVMPRARR